jgi:hypothetical protein
MGIPGIDGEPPDEPLMIPGPPGPGDLSAWSTWTPTVTPITGTITTLGAHTGRYKAIGKTIIFQFSVTITTNGSAATGINVSLPFTASAFEFTALGMETNNTGKLMRGFMAVSSTSIQLKFYDNTYPGGDGARLVVTGVYESV